MLLLRTQLLLRYTRPIFIFRLHVIIFIICDVDVSVHYKFVNDVGKQCLNYLHLAVHRVATLTLPVTPSATQCHWYRKKGPSRICKEQEDIRIDAQ